MTAPVEGLSTEERRRQSRLDALSRRIEDHRTVRRVRNEEIIDAVGLLILGLIALTGMANVYGGLRYLVVGGLGLAIGIGIAWAFARRAWPIWGVVALVLAVVLLLGPSLIDPARAWSTTVPTPGVARSLLTASFEGWADVLGTTTPVGASQGLLVLPLVSGTATADHSVRVEAPAPAGFVRPR